MERSESLSLLSSGPWSGEYLPESSESHSETPEESEEELRRLFCLLTAGE